MKKWIVLLALGLVLVSFAVTKAGKSIVCTRVVDGDTIVISDGDKVRLIGIDTPEVYESGKLDKDMQRTGKDKKTIQALGKQASDYTKKLLEGKQIKLEYDPANTYINNRDKYGRLLAYVYLEVPSPQPPEVFKSYIGKYLGEKKHLLGKLHHYEVFFNAQIISEGYAYAYMKYPFKYMDEFRKYEKEARENHRGLWAGEDFQKGVK